MAILTHEEILDSCIAGIKRSFKEYKKWSGGEWLWKAPEYLITVNIAKSLAKINKPKFITLEDNVKYILDMANAKIKGPLKQKVRGNGRSDIVLWWGKGSVRGIIEVKNRVFSINHILVDVERIIGILEKDSDIELGAIAFYVDKHFEVKNAQDTIENKILTIMENLEKIARKNNLKYKWKYEEIESTSKDSSFSVVFMFYK